MLTSGLAGFGSGLVIVGTDGMVVCGFTGFGKGLAVCRFGTMAGILTVGL